MFAVLDSAQASLKSLKWSKKTIESVLHARKPQHLVIYYTSWWYSQGNPVSIINTVHEFSSVPWFFSRASEILNTFTLKSVRCLIDKNRMITRQSISPLQWISESMTGSVCPSATSRSLCSGSWTACPSAIPSSVWSSTASRAALRSESERSDRRRERWSSSARRTR